MSGTKRLLFSTVKFVVAISLIQCREDRQLYRAIPEAAKPFWFQSEISSLNLSVVNDDWSTIEKDNYTKLFAKQQTRADFQGELCTSVVVICPICSQRPLIHHLQNGQPYEAIPEAATSCWFSRSVCISSLYSQRPLIRYRREEVSVHRSTLPLN